MQTQCNKDDNNIWQYRHACPDKRFKNCIPASTTAETAAAACPPFFLFLFFLMVSGNIDSSAAAAALGSSSYTPSCILDFCCSCTQAGILELTPTRQNYLGLEICTGKKVQACLSKHWQDIGIVLQVHVRYTCSQLPLCLSAMAGHAVRSRSYCLKFILFAGL